MYSYRHEQKITTTMQLHECASDHIGGRQAGTGGISRVVELARVAFCGLAQAGATDAAGSRPEVHPSLRGEN